MTTENLTAAPNKEVEDAKQQLLEKLDRSINWYSENSRRRGWWARSLRVWMIVFGGVSAIIPMLSQIKLHGWPEISPLWASIFIAMTATLFAFEKYYGHSDAWMRFVLAKQELERLKEDFLLTCLGLSLTSASPDVLKKSVDELMRVSKERHLIIKQETSAWTKVFESGMKSSAPIVTSVTASK